MPAQGLFKKNDTYIVVKRIRLGGNKWIEIGTEVSRKDYRVFRLKSWHFRRMIGKKGNRWTEAMLNLGGRHYAMPELNHGVEEEPTQVAVPTADRIKRRNSTVKKSGNKRAAV